MNAYLGLGSNLGDRFRNLSEAVRRLNETGEVEVREISPVYETEPDGDPGQPEYLNAALRVETALDARKLLKACLGVEKAMGRVREEHWGPRNIDIDLLVYGDVVLSTKDLSVPHPLLHEREFVLRPLADIAPELVHPVIFDTVSQLLGDVEKRGAVRRDDLKLMV